jgi:hypothetical protein
VFKVPQVFKAHRVLQFLVYKVLKAFRDQLVFKDVKVFRD